MIEDIRLISSAVREGIAAACQNSIVNPFVTKTPPSERQEMLRKAFHFGWMSVQEMGEEHYTLEQLLQIKE